MTAKRGGGMSAAIARPSEQVTDLAVRLAVGDLRPGLAEHLVLEPAPANGIFTSDMNNPTTNDTATMPPSPMPIHFSSSTDPGMI